MTLIINSYKEADDILWSEVNKDVFDTLLLYDKANEESVSVIKAEIEKLKEKGYEIALSLKIETHRI
jgi:hypothetical protein